MIMLPSPHSINSCSGQTFHIKFATRRNHTTRLRSSLVKMRQCVVVFSTYLVLREASKHNKSLSPCHLISMQSAKSINETLPGCMC
ncbi:hypothetical protein DU500_07340 [Haloplanus rubicundus]|uniref:Uncharacterized protein n=1 Tax=Haloplanus rubicundus TaxID=1547898 RepID=A0A345E244_9EURY|nr:hypothetical protein DU500_07340 [Haloplanus rubicundus]